MEKLAIHSFHSSTRHTLPRAELSLVNPAAFPERVVDNSVRGTVERVVEVMRSNLGEQLTLDDLARVASYSKFHFSRMFQRETGISPGRFLSALRLERAKQLLIATSFNVADISLQVGYTSIGSFSTRFTRSVGLAPTTYRSLRGFAPLIEPEPGDDGPERTYGTVRGRLWHEWLHRNQVTFLGLFRDRIPEGKPVACMVVENASHFILDKVPPGKWFLLSHSVPAGEIDSALDLSQAGVQVSTVGPVTVWRGAVVDADVHLRRMTLLDPPVLLSLLDIRRGAMSLVAGRDMTARAAFRDRMLDRLAA